MGVFQKNRARFPQEQVYVGLGEELYIQSQEAIYLRRETPDCWDVISTIAMA